MVRRLVKKNTYGGTTFEIEIEPLFLIYIHGTENGEYVVEFKEHQVLWKSTRFSFVSNNDLISTMHEAYDRVFTWFQNHKTLIWTEQQCWRSRQLSEDGLENYLRNSLKGSS